MPISPIVLTKTKLWTNIITEKAASAKNDGNPILNTQLLMVVDFQ